MSPTLTPGDPVWVVEGYYKVNPVVQGDLVAIQFALRNEPMVKRVVATAGDEVTVENGILSVASESYEIPTRGTAVLTKQLAQSGGKVPPNNLITLGDNPKASMDSAMFGFISVRKLEGRVFLSPPPGRSEKCSACHRSRN